MQAVKTANPCCSPDHKRHSDQAVKSAAAALVAPSATETSEIKASQVGTVYCIGRLVAFRSEVNDKSLHFASIANAAVREVFLAA